MTRLINPDQQYFDNDTGAPLALGTVYFGEPNQDPETNPKAVYSNAALTVALSPTQTLTAAGKHGQPIFLDGAYSMTVRDALGSLVWNEDYVTSPDGLPQGGNMQDAIQYVTPAMRGGLQNAIDYCVSTGASLYLADDYDISEKLTIGGSLHTHIVKPSTITWTGGAVTADAIVESTTGVLRITGEQLTIDGGSNSGTGNILASLQKYAQIENVLILRNMPSGTAYRASESYTVNGTAMTGRGWADAVVTENVTNGLVIYGNADWYKNDVALDSYFRIGDKCKLNGANAGQAYLVNKVKDVEVGAANVQDWNGFYREYTTQADSADWAASTEGSVTVSKNTFTTSGGGAGIYTSDLDLEVGQEYYVLFDGETTASGVEIRNGSSSGLLVTSTLGQVASFTAADTFLYLRHLGAGTTQLSDFVVWKKSSVINNIFQCANIKVDGATYRGVQRGPTIGIDSKNYTVSNCRAYGLQTFGIQIDTESFGTSPEPLYPDAYATVNGCVVKYAGTRGLYSTCRRVRLDDLSFYYACDGFGVLRFNTRNEAQSTSQIVVGDISAFGCTTRQVMSVARGSVRIAGSIIHDSTAAAPFSCDSASTDSAIIFKDCGKNDVQDITVDETYIRVGDDLFVTSYSDAVTALDIRVPNTTFVRCKGWKVTGVRLNSTGNIRFKPTVGGSTINGATSTLTWPTTSPHAHITCVSDSNDFIITFS